MTPPPFPADQWQQRAAALVQQLDLDEDPAMHIEIPQDTITAAVVEATARAITAGVGDWQLQREIAAAVVAAVAEVDMPAMVAAEVRRLLADQGAAMVAAAVQSAAPAITAAIAASVEQAHVGMVAGLLAGKPAPYDTTGQAAWAQARALVAGKTATPTTADAAKEPTP